MSAVAHQGGGRIRALLTRSRLIAASLVLAGAVLFGQGVWIKGKAFLAQILLERAFTASLATGRPVKPWSWFDSWPVARVEVPRLGRSAIVLAGASGQALAFGPGQVAGTPEAGEAGTTVFAAHRDTHFSFLGEVRAGDDIVVTTRQGKVWRYVVSSEDVVRWDASGIDPKAPGHNLALATCWPLSAITHGPLRLVVHARLAEPAPAPSR